MSHMVQMLTYMNPRQTVVSVDGIGAIQPRVKERHVARVGQHARWCEFSHSFVPLYFLRHTFGRISWVILR